MASKFTIRPMPHLPINEMRIHLSLFVQEPGSKSALSNLDVRKALENSIK